MNEPLLNVQDLASLLKMTRRQVYGLLELKTRNSSSNPIPFLKIHGNVRFLRADIEAWLMKEREVSHV
jgi:predicted DNA-binding transcriptional regulator AlpA